MTMRLNVSAVKVMLSMRSLDPRTSRYFGICFSPNGQPTVAAVPCKFH